MFGLIGLFMEIYSEPCRVIVSAAATHPSIRRGFEFSRCSTCSFCRSSQTLGSLSCSQPCLACFAVLFSRCCRSTAQSWSFFGSCLYCNRKGLSIIILIKSGSFFSKVLHRLMSVFDVTAVDTTTTKPQRLVCMQKLSRACHQAASPAVMFLLGELFKTVTAEFKEE